MPGVVRTRVGYAGGTQANPTYDNIGDHAEVLEVDFDPVRISYDQLLETFWNSHSPFQEPWKRQYMSAILFHGSTQEEAARLSHENASALLGRRLYTEIAPCDAFYLAEDYHQKFMLRRAPEVKAEVEALLPDHAAFVASTAVAKINGYVGGNGTLEDFNADLPLLGLSEKASTLLRRAYSRHS